MSDRQPPQRYFMKKADLAVEIANMAGIMDYDPSRAQKSGPACFTRDERRCLYEVLSGKSGEGLKRKELTPLIMQELDTELNSVYPYEFTREDLKIIHKALSERQS